MTKYDMPSAPTKPPGELPKKNRLKETRLGGGDPFEEMRANAVKEGNKEAVAIIDKMQADGRARFEEGRRDAELLAEVDAEVAEELKARDEDEVMTPSQIGRALDDTGERQRVKSDLLKEYSQMARGGG